MTAKPNLTDREPEIDYKIFLPALCAALLCALPLIIAPEKSADAANAAFGFVTQRFGWLYLWFGMFALFFCIWLSFGKYGNVKLGAPDEAPEYSNRHWIAMMFTAGIGGSLIAWGFAESMYYLKSPPLGIEAGTSMATEMAHVYPLFHWGIIPWAIYALPAVPIAYMLYVKRTPQMRMSNGCDEALPANARGPAKLLIDIFIVLGVLGGTATSLGLGVPLVSALVAELFGVADTTMIKLCVLLVWVGLFGASAYRGLRRGIKILADINMVLAILVTIFVLIVGPTTFILSLSVNSLGLLVDNFARASLWMDPIDKGGFPESWTVFYWAWWLAYAGLVGLFFGRISRGRTIRELLMGVICWGTLGTWAFLAVASAFSLHVDAANLAPIAVPDGEKFAHMTSDVVSLSTALNEGIITMSEMVAKILATLPFGGFVLFVYIVLCLVFYATTMDSAAYVLASICAKDMKNDEEPRRSNRLVWAVVIALITAGVVLTGRLDTVKSATVISSLPLIPILGMMCFTLLKWLKQDFGDQVSKPELVRNNFEA